MILRTLIAEFCRGAFWILFLDGLTRRYLSVRFPQRRPSLILPAKFAGKSIGHLFPIYKGALAEIFAFLSSTDFSSPGSKNASDEQNFRKKGRERSLPVLQRATGGAGWVGLPKGGPEEGGDLETSHDILAGCRENKEGHKNLKGVLYQPCFSRQGPYIFLKERKRFAPLEQKVEFLKDILFFPSGAG
ncbi:MAG: hypothetical protein PHP25_02860 [Candidatus Moranbacteria bacterium]|nr:hypothetical protein [Candidatus Moranbacteria bacterium]